MSLVFQCDFCGKAYNVENNPQTFGDKYVYGEGPNKQGLPLSPLSPCSECIQAKERAANEALDKIKANKK